MPAGQKRTPDLITDGYEPPCGCQELNSGPLEEQAMLLTTEPSLLFNEICFSQSGVLVTSAFPKYVQHSGLHGPIAC